jgi:sRNA-binding carbon storage regulator CsrA
MAEKGNLILTRQVNQQVVFADGEIILTVKRIHGNRVTFAIAAERDLKILRGEIASGEVRAKLAEVAL